MPLDLWSTSGLLVPAEAAASGGFTDPTSLSGLAFWGETLTSATLLNGSDAPPSDMETVKQFTDLSGNNNHATQGTDGNRPNFVAAGLNSKGVLIWTQLLTQRLVLGTPIVLSGDFFIAFLGQSTGGNADTFIGDTAGQAALLISASTNLRLRDNSGVQANFTIGDHAGNPHLFMVERVGSTVSAWVDGAAATPVGSYSGTVTLTRFGARNTSDPLSGGTAGMVICSASQTLANKNACAHYLADPYAVSIADIT